MLECATNLVPRVKQGSIFLDSKSLLAVFYNNNEQVSCQAELDIMAPARDFDKIEWFIFNKNKNLNFSINRSINQSAPTIVTISSTFQPYPQMFDDSLFKCCTTLNGNELLCQNIYMIGTYVVPSSSTRLYLFRYYYILVFTCILVYFI